MDHIFFIHLSVDRHLGCFRVLAVVNSAAMNIGVCVSFWIRVLSRDMQSSQFFNFLAESKAHFSAKADSTTRGHLETSGDFFFFNIYLAASVLSFGTWDQLLLLCGILVPGPGIEPEFPTLQNRVLTTGPPGKSLEMFFCWPRVLLNILWFTEQPFCEEWYVPKSLYQPRPRHLL